MGFAKGSIHGEKLWRATYRLRLLRTLPPIVAQMIVELRGEGLDDAAIRREVLAACERSIVNVMPECEGLDARRAEIVPEVAREVVELLLEKGGVRG